MGACPRLVVRTKSPVRINGAVGVALVVALIRETSLSAPVSFRNKPVAGAVSAVSSTDKTEQKLFASSCVADKFAFSETNPCCGFSEQKNFACTVDDSLDLDYDVSLKQSKMFKSHSSGVSHNLQQSSLPQGITGSMDHWVYKTSL